MKLHIATYQFMSGATIACVDEDRRVAMRARNKALRDYAAVNGLRRNFFDPDQLRDMPIEAGVTYLVAGVNRPSTSA